MNFIANILSQCIQIRIVKRFHIFCEIKCKGHYIFLVLAVNNTFWFSAAPPNNIVQAHRLWQFANCMKLSGMIIKILYFSGYAVNQYLLLRYRWIGSSNNSILAVHRIRNQLQVNLRIWKIRWGKHKTRPLFPMTKHTDDFVIKRTASVHWGDFLRFIHKDIFDWHIFKCYQQIHQTLRRHDKDVLVNYSILLKDIRTGWSDNSIVSLPHHVF